MDTNNRNIVTDIPYAITTLNMTPLYGNPLYYELIEDRVNHTVFSILNEQDANLISKDIKSFSCGQEKCYEVLIYNKKRLSQPALLNIKLFKGRPQKTINASNNEINMYEITLYPLDNLKERLDESRYIIKKYHTFLSLKYTLAFEYDISDDILNIYWIANAQKIFFFKQTLEIFENDLITQDTISPSSINIFHNFCNDLRNQILQFNYQFQTSFFTKTSSMETYLVNGETITRANGSIQTIGIFSLFNEHTMTVQDNLLEEIFLDPLTKILRKNEIAEHAQNLILDSLTENVSLCVIDIDNFKSVNDSFGHMFGDKVLRAAADVMSDAAGLKGVPGRIGGDEFLLVLKNLKDELELRNILRAIRSGLDWIFPEQLSQIQFGCSIGVASYPKDANNYIDLFHIADKCAYIAKAKGKRRYIIYDKNLHGIYDPSQAEFVQQEIMPLNQANCSNVGNLLAILNKTGKNGISSFLKDLALLYDFTRITLFCGKDFSYTHTYYENDFEPPKNADYANNTHYDLNFDLNNFFSLNNVHNLEFSNPKLCAEFKKLNMRSVYQYLCLDKNNNIRGLISYEFCKKQISLSPDKQDFLIIISKILESFIYKD